MHEFEGFEAQKFVGRLLGKGDWGGFIDKVKDVIPEVGGGWCLGGFEGVSRSGGGGGDSGLNEGKVAWPGCCACK
jgi:hypothetical protein